MANEFTERAIGGLGVPAVTDSPLTPMQPVGPPTPTMDLDTGLPWAVEGETIAQEAAEYVPSDPGSAAEEIREGN